jgi:serine/threonine protein kinase
MSGLPEEIQSAEVTQMKEAGNDAYRVSDYVTAIQKFTEGITLALALEVSVPSNNNNHVYILYTNRAMCYASLNPPNWKECIRDSEFAIKSNPKHIKAYFWLVKGLIELKMIREARQHLLIACKDCGSAADGNKQFKELENELNKIYGTPLRPKPSDFEIMEELGDGNFSKIYKAELKSNRNPYAIKVIEVQTVDRMKRRHRNIHNEILMEKRALTKLNHPGIVTLYATFKDYGSLYYQMEFMAGGELWGSLQEKDDSGINDGTFGLSNAVGLHVSIARFVMGEAINALEYMHNKGIVHRDIKPENMLFNAAGHIKFVDFGTAKDLVQTDLNGPEFVGTPEYMSPSTVGSKTVGPEGDLWAMGIVFYQMLTGFTPFAAPSPYLSFLRTKRAALRVPDWASNGTIQLLRTLLNRNSDERLANCCSTEKRNDIKGAINYDTLRRSPFFSECNKNAEVKPEEFLQLQRSLYDRPAVRVPNLSELCRRAVGRASVVAATKIAEHGGVKPDPVEFPDLKWIKKFSLGNITEDDMDTSNNRITRADRQYIIHYLNRRQQINNPGLYRLFNKNLMDTKCIRTDFTTREYLGYNRSTQGSWKNSGVDQGGNRSGPQGKDKGITGVISDFLFAHIGTPSFNTANDYENGPICEHQTEAMKKLITKANRLRPKFVVVSGNFTSKPFAVDGNGDYCRERDAFRKTIARMGDSVPLVFVPGPNEMGLVCSGSNDGIVSNYPTKQSIESYHKHFGLDFYGMWFNGIRYLIVNSSLFFCKKYGESGFADLMKSSSIEDGEYVAAHVAHQDNWLAEEIDQSKLCSTQLVILSSHPWFNESIDEEGNWGNVVPKIVRLKWLRRIQHYRATIVLTGGFGQYTNLQKKHFCFPNAAIAASERKKTKEIERSLRKKNRIRPAAATDDDDEGDQKRRDDRKTPSKKNVDDNDNDEGLLPSQIIAKARASGELPPPPPPAAAINSDSRVQELPDGDDDNDDDSQYVCAVEGEEPPESPVKAVEDVEYSDTDSSGDDEKDNDKDEYDDQLDGLSTDGDSETDGEGNGDGDGEGAPKEKFKNVDRNICGPEMVGTSSNISNTKLKDGENESGLRLIQMREDGYNHKFFTCSEDIDVKSI